MAETLTWNFTGNDRLTDLLEKLSVTLGSVDRKLADFGKTSTKVKAETKGLEDGVKDLGDKAEKAGVKVKRAFRGIDEEIAATAVELRALQLEFAKTGDEALFKKIGSKKSALSGLTGVVKDLGGDAEKIIADALQGGAKTGLTAGFKDALSSVGGLAEMPGIGQVGGGLAAALAVPALAGAGGGLAAVAGVGAVGAGIGGAIAGDPERFRIAWAAQITAVKGDWISASKAFTDPTLAAIATVGPMVANWHLDKTLGAAAGYVQPLVTGIEGFVNGLEAGIADLVTNAGPVITTLSSVLPDIGRMVGEGLTAVAQNSQGGAQALGDILQAAGGLVDVLLKIVAASELAYESFKATDAAFANFIRDNRVGLGVLTFGLSEVALHVSDAFNSDEVGHFGAELQGVPSTIDHIGASAEQTKQQMADLSAKFDDLVNKALGADDATLAFNKDLLDLAATIKKNGHAIDENTASGIANRQMVNGAIGDAERSRQANIENGMTIADATAKYDAQIATLRAHLKQLGFTTAQIDLLTAAADNVPSQIDIQVNLKGASAAGAAISQLLASTGGKITSSRSHRALGGSVMPGGTYQVNEQGIETFQPNVPGRIVPAGQGGGGSDVLGVLQVVHMTPGGEVIRTELLELKRQRGLSSLGF